MIVTLSTSLFVFHLIFFSSHLIMFHFISFNSRSISFISSTVVDLIHIYLIWFHHSTLLSVSPFSQFCLWKYSLPEDKYSLDKYSLLEAGLWWFCYSLSLYIRQVIQQWFLINCNGSKIKNWDH